MSIICPTCNATKKMLGNGGMRYPCTYCNQTGFIQDEVKIQGKNSQKSDKKQGKNDQMG